MGRAAYETIRDVWNAEHAACALLRFVEGMRQGRLCPEEAGPLSEAPIIRPGKYPPSDDPESKRLRDGREGADGNE